MHCPSCDSEDIKVIDSRPNDTNNSIRRRRECEACGYRFTTYEYPAETQLLVTKSDGSSERFDRDKLMRGITIACAKRPITPNQINEIINDIEDELRSRPRANISSAELGEMALRHLRGLDDVAFIRFASVYQDFKTIEEFARALETI